MAKKKVSSRKKSRPTGAGRGSPSSGRDSGRSIQSRANGSVALVVEVEALLRVGDYLKALVQWPDQTFDSPSTNQPLDTLQIRSAAISAELRSYGGRDADADAIRRPFVEEDDGEALLLRADVSARAKQALVVEHFYAARRFDKAKEAAEKVTSLCERADDYEGAGIATYGLARCYARLHDKAVYDACDLAAAMFLKSVKVDGVEFGRSNSVDLFLRWRMGLLDLLKGFARWGAGELDIGMSRLLVAKWCLAGTGDFLGLANIEHSIGTIHRSTGEADRAIEVLGHARTTYEKAGHHVNLARCLTNTGRAHLDLGRFDDARKCLEEALHQAETASSNQEMAECMVWLCWLHRAAAAESRWASLDTALKHGQDAAELKFPSNTQIATEAAIALGHCQLAQGEMNSAEKSFLDALERSKDGFPKLRIHAHLSLAELYCSLRGNLHKALKHHSAAKDALKIASTRFLTKKEQEVFTKIESLRSAVWFVTSDALFKEGSGGLKTALDDLRSWALEHVSEDDTLRGQARRLGLSPTGLKKMMTSKRAKS